MSDVKKENETELTNKTEEIVKIRVWEVYYKIQIRIQYQGHETGTGRTQRATQHPNTRVNPKNSLNQANH